MNKAAPNPERTRDGRENHELHDSNRFDFRDDIREFIDFLPHHIMIFDVKGCLLYANRSVLDYTGRTLDEMLELETAERIRKDIHPDDIRRGNGERGRRFERGEPFEFERRARRRDGVFRWFLFRYKPLQDKLGNILQWICTATDIELTKQADEKLRLVVDTMPAYIHSASPDGTVDYLNQRWFDYIGSSLDGVLSRESSVGDKANPDNCAIDLARSLHPDDLNSFTERWEEVVQSGESSTFEGRVRRFDGQFRWFLFQPAPLYDDSGKIVKWYVASIDIDDRCHSEEKLRRKDLEVANQLRVAINTTPFLAWTARPDGSAEFLNDRWLDYSGLSLDEALDWKFLVAIHPEDISPVMEIYKRALASGTLFEAEARIRRFDGEYRWFLFRGCPFRDDSGAIVRWFGANTDIEDRKRADEALRASEQSLRLVIDTIPGLVHIASPTGEVEYVSQKEIDYFGKTFDELKNWTGLVHPDDLERLENNWQDRIRTGALYDMEIRLLRADNRYRWIYVQGVPLRNDAGEIIRWYFLMTDVDERHNASEEIGRRERYLAEGQRLSRTASFSWRMPDKKLMYLSEEGFRIYGFPLGQVLPEWEERVNYVHPEDRQRWQEVVDQAIKHKSDYEMEYRIVHPSGAIKWLRIVGHAIFDAQDRLAEYVGTVIDITEQHKAEDAMRNTERWLRLVIETIPALVWSTEADGDTIFANQQFLNYAGRSTEDMRHFNWLNLIHPDDVEETRISWFQSIEFGYRHERTHRIRRADGVYRWFRSIAEPLRHDSGRISQWFGVNIDIDDGKKMAEALRTTQTRLSRAMQIATVAELSASIAHEINQPLGAVVANGDACDVWLSSNPPNIDRARLAVQRIIRDGNAAAEVIHRIRALFKQAAPNKVDLDMNEVITEVLGLVSHEIDRKGIRIETDLSADLPRVGADRIQMQQLMINLVHNGMESMERLQDQPRLLVLRSRHEGQDGSSVKIEVSDHGLGLEDTERIFESFYTTKEKGMGMGLSICRSIVDAHGGSLWAKKNDGYGTTFSFTIPIHAEMES